MKICFLIVGLLTGITNYSQWSKLKKGSKLTYDYSLITTNEIDSGSSTFKKEYIVVLDTILFTPLESNEKVIIFSNNYPPSLDYSRTKNYEEYVSMFYIKGDKVYKLWAHRNIVSILNTKKMVGQFFNLIRQYLNKDIYSLRDETAFNLDSFQVEFMPWIKVRSRQKDNFNDSNSYKGFFKFYSYQGTKTIDNLFNSKVDAYQQSSYLRGSNQIIYFSNDYGVIFSNEEITMGNPNYKIQLELKKIE